MKYIVGIVLILAALFILGGTYFPVIREEINYNIGLYQTPQDIKPIEPIDTDFGIVIPKIKANAHVIKDVDPYVEKIYQQALTKGVAHAKTTRLPGQKGNIFIFSHSSSDFFNAAKYNSVFYLLTKLEKGDIIKLYYENMEYEYAVDEKMLVEAYDVEYLEQKSEAETVTLMTCWPPGTSQKRLIVRATRLLKL